ncbi:hypothetical protein CN220_34185 [Sinorhizobium meliloti]|nr:hypothetical protein CN220_34185 [Sinorhizobium meliloti]
MTRSIISRSHCSSTRNWRIPPSTFVCRPGDLEGRQFHFRSGFWCHLHCHRGHKPADSDEAAPLFRDDCAPGFRDDLAPCLVGSAGDDCCQFIQARCQALVSDKETPSSSIGVGYGMAERRFHRV